MKKLVWLAFLAAAGCGGLPEGNPDPAEQARSISSPLRIQECPDPNHCTVPDAATEGDAGDCADTGLSTNEDKPPVIRGQARLQEGDPPSPHAATADGKCHKH